MAEDLGAWLRRVRPGTAADDGWEASPQAQQILAAVHSAAPDANTSRLARRLRSPLWWGPGTLVAAAAAVILVVATSATPSPHDAHRWSAGGAVPVAPLPAVRPAAFLLQPYQSCSDLLQSLRSHTAASMQSWGLPGIGGGFPGGLDRPVTNGMATMGVAASAPASGATSAGSAGSSTTNDQETGVDEPDIVKVDGDHVVTITDGVLRVLDSITRHSLGSLDLTLYDGWEGAQLFVSGTTALVMLSAAQTGYGATSAAKSTFLFVDLAGTPHVTGSLRVSGAYVDARMVGSTVRLVVNSAPTLSLPLFYGGSAQAEAAANKHAVLTAPLSAWLPSYAITSGTTTTTHTLGCTQVSHAADFSGASMLSIYTLDMADLGADPEPVSVAADGNTVYATQSSLYIASNPYWFYDVASATKQTTQVHRFDISRAGAPTYLGSGSVPGRLLSSYSLSEDGGYLRVATTSGTFPASGTSSSVYVLSDDTLKVAGQVTGLGRGEQIYAVRFVGSLAYVVTYQQTDPLYVLDLHDPAAPRVLGSLPVSGVSSYLHDLGGGRVLGVGQQLTDGEGSGVQVSLFDVSNPASPRRTANVVLPNTPGGLRFDPHTFLYWPQTGLVAVPVNSWSGTQSGRELVVHVSGDQLTEVGLVSNPRPASSADDGLGIQRSLIVNGDLWTVSGGGVLVSTQSSLAQIAWIPFS